MDRVDEERFREFVAARSGALLRTAYLLVGDRGRAEDLVQTSLIKAYLAWHRIRSNDAVEAYVRRVLATTAVSWWRRRWTLERPTAVLPDVSSGDTAVAVAEADAMQRHLMCLPARQRAVLVLRYYDDMTEAEIASVLGLSRGAVSSYATRGLTALRARIGEGVVR